MSNVFRGPEDDIVIDDYNKLPKYVKVYIATQFTTGRNLPSGGNQGQFLTKATDEDFSTSWSWLPLLTWGQKQYDGSTPQQIELLDLCELIQHTDIDNLF